MAISYKRLLKMLIDKDLTKKDFCNVQTDILETICLKMDCQLSDIAEILPDPEPTQDSGTDGFEE